MPGADRSRYTILHVVAHGKATREPRETLVFLEDEDRRAQAVEKHQLIARLGLLAAALPQFIFFAAASRPTRSCR